MQNSFLSQHNFAEKKFPFNDLLLSGSSKECVLETSKGKGVTETYSSPAKKLQWITENNIKNHVFILIFSVFWRPTQLAPPPVQSNPAVASKAKWSFAFMIDKIHMNDYVVWELPLPPTLWFLSEDMFQLIVMPQGIEKVTIQLLDTPTKVLICNRC